MAILPMLIYHESETRRCLPIIIARYNSIELTMPETNTRLGSTNLQVPRIIFGTSGLGNLYEAVPYEIKLAIISEWFQQAPGIVAADSAGKYGAGLALETMGKALAELKVDPNDIVISNKLAWRRTPLVTEEPTFEPGAWVGLEHDAVQDISYEGILRCHEEGCELLGDYKPQMVSVHDPDEYLAAASDETDREKRWDDILAAYQALVELREKGEVAAIGVGSKDWRISKELSEKCKLDWVMLATSLTLYTHQSELLAFVDQLKQQNTGVINSAVFNAGFLVGGPFFDYRKITGDEVGDAELLAWREQFNSICVQHDVKPAEACVAFGMSPPGVVATALSSSKPSRIKENVALCHANPPAKFWEDLKSAGLLADDYPHV